MTAFPAPVIPPYAAPAPRPSRTPGWPAQRNLGPPPPPDDGLYANEPTPDAGDDAAAVNVPPHEKIVDSASKCTLEERARFGSAVVERRRWQELLPKIESNERTVDRFENCGSLAYIESNTATRNWRIRCNKCKLRICPACRIAMQHKYTLRIRQVVGNIGPREWQHITLTIRHTDEPLDQQIKFLRGSFRKLRHRNQWKRSVAHGYAVLEITYNTEKREWHPHLHILARTRFIDYSQLRKDWKQITRGSDHVHCRHLKPNDTAAEYICSYLGKPPTLEMLADSDVMAEYYNAIKSARLMLPFGYTEKLPDAPKSNDPPDAWKSHGSLTDFINRLKNDDHVALSTLDIIYDKKRVMALRIIRTANIEPTIHIEARERDHTTDMYSLCMPDTT